MEKLIIKGVNINLDAEDFKKVKNLKNLQKLNIFEHLSEEEKSDAENELLIKLGIKEEVSAQTE